MKKYLFSILTILALSLAACGGDHQHNHSDGDQNAPGTSAVHGEGKEYTSAYVCPMHCKDSGGDQAGTCPVCGMDYVSQADHAKDGHKH